MSELKLTSIQAVPGSKKQLPDLSLGFEFTGDLHTLTNEQLFKAINAAQLHPSQLIVRNIQIFDATGHSIDCVKLVIHKNNRRLLSDTRRCEQEALNQINLVNQAINNSVNTQSYTAVVIGDEPYEESIK